MKDNYFEEVLASIKVKSWVSLIKEDCSKLLMMMFNKRNKRNNFKRNKPREQGKYKKSQ